MENRHYRFDTTAFRMVPPGASPYLHAEFAQTLAALEEACRRGEGCIVLSGPPGTGKTTLAEQLTRRFRAAGGIVPPVISGQVAGDDLLRLVAFALGIDKETDKARLYLAVEERLGRHYARGHRVLLCIDEAQDLEETALEELRLLCVLQRDSRPLLQILLVGQPGLLRELGTPALERFRQRIAAIHRLDPLSRDETRAYIGHRLVVAGWRGGPVISGSAIELLHEFSGGVPAWINLAVGRVLWRGDAEGRDPLDAEFTAAVLAEMEQDGLFPTKENRDPLGLFATSEDTDPLMPLEAETAEAIVRSLEVDRRRELGPSGLRPWHGLRKLSIQRPLLDQMLARPWRPVLGGAVVVVVSALLGTYLGSTSSTLDTGVTSSAAQPVEIRGLPEDTPPVAAEFVTEARETPPSVPNQPLEDQTHAVVVATATPGSSADADDQSSAEVAVTPMSDAPADAAELAVVEIVWSRTDQPSGEILPMETVPVEDAISMESASPEFAELPVGAELTEFAEPVVDATNASTDPLEPSEPPFSPTAEETVVGPSVSEAIAVATAGDEPPSSPSELERVLAAGTAALAQDRLTFPQGNSAFDHFTAALRLDPENGEAQDGLQQISDRYEQLATEAIEQGELEEADRYIARGLRIKADDSALTELQQEVKDLVAARELPITQPIAPDPEPVEVLPLEASPPPLQVQPVRHHALDY